MSAERAAFEQADASLALGLLVDFHRLLAELLGNRVLCEMMGDLLSRSSLIALKMPIPDAAEHAHEEHVQIVQALETGNAALARRLMGEHLAQVQTLLQPATRKPDLLSALRPQASTP
jgi:DNA-binding GntR family transcriptional regulator